ncbi:MAG TPA: hypothetical protein VH301_09780 [Usitatibacter sp.]|nr:hypothetical protein [Usitatibacter sp.]
MSSANEKGTSRPDDNSGGQQQQQSGEGQQYGEGNYKATRQYNEGLKDHVQNHDIEREARDAAPKSDAEAKEMERAEEEGRSRAKGDSKDMPEDPSEP